MAEQEKTEKQFRVCFNATKKEEFGSAGAKFSTFINNTIRPYAKVSIFKNKKTFQFNFNQ